MYKLKYITTSVVANVLPGPYIYLVMGKVTNDLVSIPFVRY